MEYVKLNDGLEIPAIGFGTFLIPADGTTYETVKNARFGEKNLAKPIKQRIFAS